MSAAATSELSDDPAELKAMLTAERALRAELASEIQRLEAIIAAFRRAVFGRRSEKLDPEQLELDLEEAEQELAEARATRDAADERLKTTRRERRQTNRGALPAHLERIEQVIEPEEKSCPCCGGALHAIGEDVAERLDVVPAQFRVLVTRRPEYACRACTEGVVQAPAPLRLVEGGLPTEATVAHVLVAKYGDHLPLYRQAQICGRPIRVAVATLIPSGPDRSLRDQWPDARSFDARRLRRLLPPAPVETDHRLCR